MGIGLLPALQDAGFDPKVQAALIANAEHESGGDPSAVGDNGNSVGLWQWNGDRAHALMDYAEGMGSSPADVRVQVAFLQKELADKPDILKAMNSATSPGEAASIFAHRFERPSGVAEKAMARADTANGIYAQLFPKALSQAPQNFAQRVIQERGGVQSPDMNVMAGPAVPTPGFINAAPSAAVGLAKAHPYIATAAVDQLTGGHLASILRALIGGVP